MSSYLGAAEEGPRGRKVLQKALLVVAAEEDGREIGRIRLRPVQDASSASLQPVAALMKSAGVMIARV